jgi:hypothetical protein
LNHIGIHISDSFHVTECHALRVTVTVIALHGHPVLTIEEGVTKRACDDTGPTSDTQIFIDNHTIIILDLPVAGLGGTDFDAIGLFAVVAGHGKVNPYILPFHHLDPGPARIARPGMMDGTDQLTETASGTLLLIHNQYFLLHFNSPLFSSLSTHT